MAGRRPGKRKFEHIGDVLEGVLQKCRRETNDVLNRLGSGWGAIVGPLLAEYSRPAAMKGSLLLVYVTSPVWLQEMRFMKADILAAIERSLGDRRVADVRFKVG